MHAQLANPANPVNRARHLRPARSTADPDQTSTRP